MTLSSLSPRSARAVVVVLCVVALSACSASDEQPDDGSSTSAAPTSAPADDAVSTLVDTGLAQLGAQDVAAAEGTFTNVLAVDPTNVYALYNLGLIAQQGGRDKAATDYYGKALASDPDYTPALYNGAILLEATDVEAAIDAYRRVTELDPTFAAAFVRLGFALVHTGSEEEGEAMITAGVELDPTLADVDAPTYPES